MSKNYLIWCGVMFPYGFYRQWKSQMISPYDLHGHRCVSSIFNGFIYISPFGVFKLFNLINRIDIYYNKRDKEKYPKPYEELIGMNNDTL
jgi:hypothetical protein